MSTFHGLPLSYDPYEFKHACLLTCQQNGHIDVIVADEEGLEPSSEAKKCVAAPYVTSKNFHSYDVAKMFAAIIREVLSFGFVVHLIFIINIFFF